MATDVVLPKVGFSMTEGELSEWMYADGEHVTEGEILFVFESDKSAQEVEAPATGVLRVKAEEGKTYPVGTVLGVIEPD